MNGRQIALGIVLVDFAALSSWAVWQHGYLGIFELALSSWATTVVFVDLVIALSLVLLWMFGDARERGLAFFPYALLTLLLGSVGPLLYLIRREGRVQASLPRAARAAQGA
jgi:hypothetical protein